MIVAGCGVIVARANPINSRKHLVAQRVDEAVSEGVSVLQHESNGAGQLSSFDEIEAVHSGNPASVEKAEMNERYKIELMFSDNHTEYGDYLTVMEFEYIPKDGESVKLHYEIASKTENDMRNVPKTLIPMAIKESHDENTKRTVQGQ